MNVSKLKTILFGDFDDDAQAFFDYMDGLGDPVPEAYKWKYNSTILALKGTPGRDNTVSYWDSLDYLRIQCTYSKTAALADCKGLRQAVITNDHGASFTADVGLKGDGTAFRVATNFNPSTATNFQQDSAGFGLLVLDDTTGNDNQELCALISTGSNGLFIRPKRSSANSYDSDATINSTYGGVFPTVLSSRSWYGISRVISTEYIQYMNGFRVSDEKVFTSVARINLDVIEFASVLAPATYANWSDKRHAILWFGSGNIEPNIIKEILNEYFIFPVNNSNSAIKNRVFFVGDSMTGDETNTNTALSLISHYPRRTLSNLGTNWLGAVNGNANREIIGTHLVSSLDQIYQKYILGPITGPPNQQRFKDNSLTKDIIVLFIGTNDLGFHAVTTGTTAHNALKVITQAMKTAGFSVIVCGVIDRNGGFANGQTAGNFDLARASYNSLLAADFNVATAVTNVYSPAGGITYADLYIDLYADAKFQNAADTTYFQADAIHLNTTGFNTMADDYVTDAIQLL